MGIRTKWKNWFSDHPKAVNETYLQHLVFALHSSVILLAAGITSMVHAIFPALFTNFASKKIKDLHARMEDRNDDKMA